MSLQELDLTNPSVYYWTIDFYLAVSVAAGRLVQDFSCQFES
jgi:hypothetical protein